MRAWIMPICAGLLLAACDAPGPQVDPMIEDNSRCAASGFKAGSPEMASCMQTASDARQLEASRKARADAADAQRQQIADQQRSAQDAADRDRWDRQMQSNRDEMDAMMSGRQQGFAMPDAGAGNNDNDGFNTPTAAGLPGMNCDGVGAEQRCDALSSD